MSELQCSVSPTPFIFDVGPRMVGKHEADKIFVSLDDTSFTSSTKNIANGGYNKICS